MDVKALVLGKAVTKPLDKLIEEHRHLSDTTSWYICTLGEELQKLQAELQTAKEENEKLKAEMDKWNLSTENIEKDLTFEAELRQVKEENERLTKYVDKISGLVKKLLSAFPETIPTDVIGDEVKFDIPAYIVEELRQMTKGK